MDIEREGELYQAVADEFGWLTVDQSWALCDVVPGEMEASMRREHLSKWELWVESDAGPLHPGFFLRESSVFGYVVDDVPEAALYGLRAVSPACSVWQVIEWLISPHPGLDGGRPVDVNSDRAVWATFRSLLGR